MIPAMVMSADYADHSLLLPILDRPLFSPRRPHQCLGKKIRLLILCNALVAGTAAERQKAVGCGALFPQESGLENRASICRLYKAITTKAWAFPLRLHPCA